MRAVVWWRAGVWIVWLTGTLPFSGASAGATPGFAGASPATLMTPQFRHYGIADGLPSGVLSAGVQDHRGIMWFAGSGGLSRYDGVGFIHFSHSSTDAASEPLTQLYCIAVDSRDGVWMGGDDDGLAYYDQVSGRFSHWQHDDKVPSSLASNEVWSIAQTTDGAIWIGTAHGLDRLKAGASVAASGVFEHIPVAADGSDGSVDAFGPVRALLADADGQLWIGAASGIYRRSADGRLRKIPVDPSFHGDAGKVWRIDEDHHEVRIAVTGGLLIVGHDGAARPLAAAQLATQRIMTSVRDDAGRLWLGSLDGLWIDSGQEGLRHIVAQPLLPGGLPDQRIAQILRGREGGLWFVAGAGGLAYLTPHWDGFTRYTHVPDDPGSLTDTAALSVAASRDGQLWVGGLNGWVDKLDPATGAVQHAVRGLRGVVQQLAEDRRGRLWITGLDVLHLYDHGKMLSIGADQSYAAHPLWLSVADDGHVYVATWDGHVFMVDEDSLALTPLTIDASNDRIPSALKSHDNRLWYLDGDGVFLLDQASRHFNAVPGIDLPGVSSLTFDRAGFWLKSVSSINHYRYQNGRAELIEHIDLGRWKSLPEMSAIQRDPQGNLWIVANPGLWRIDPAARTLESFGRQQGLSNDQFYNGNASIAMLGDRMFAASMGGIFAFHPEALFARHNAMPVPPVSISGLSLRENERLKPIPLQGHAVRLGWRERDVLVNAQVSSYLDPAANRYRFYLAGFDKGWVDTEHLNQREFAGLAAGTYQLDVMAAGADGVWGRLPTPLTIHVQAPPWARWWAWLSYAVLSAIGVALALRAWSRRLAQRHHLRMIEQQRQLAEAASAAKTQFLATLSHEIRTPMTGVMGMAELLLTTPLTPLQHDYTKAMQRSGGMLLKLLNDALDLARIEAGRLELELAPFDPRQLLEDVGQLEQGLAHLKRVPFVLDIADDLPARVIGDAVRIQQVLLNLANNALKFTEQGCVTLRAQRTAQGLVFSISDTGPGIPEASRARLFQRFEQEDGPHRSAGSGLGLAICRELVEMMNGSIELESRMGHGSTFHVRLPLSEPAATSAIPSAARSPLAAQRRSYRLLLVEDDTIVAAVITGLLEQQGHAVVHVANGLAALAELAHADIDAVLLDLDLPGVDGFQIARLIRQREGGGQRLPIVAVTARSGGEDERHAQAAGMDAFLRKPLSGEQLAQALARVIPSAVEATGEPC